ncbi:hypothetical protein DL95DRAFT_407461 [Leptodontidium sp. 2 PMI_412]|nr:hypothetical protein DL95DRAFT_407461 [Leptodontidium sp. 2 PMI_412]
MDLEKKRRKPSKHGNSLSPTRYLRDRPMYPQTIIPHLLKIRRPYTIQTWLRQEQLQDQLNSLQDELRKAKAEKNDAFLANKNLAKENELLEIQVHRDKIKHDKLRSTLEEDNAELREDTRELAAENTQLRREIDLLRSNVRVENSQAPILGRLKAEAQLISAELDRLRGVESQLTLETERHAAALYRLREMESDFDSLLAHVHGENENQKRQTDRLEGERKLYEEKIDELRRDRAVMGQVVQSRIEVESKQLAEIAQLTKENEGQQRQIQGLLQNQKRFEAEEAKFATLVWGSHSSEIHIQSLREENATLRTKVHDLEKDRKDKEPLTRIGASVRIAVLGDPNVADDRYNVVADAAFYKAGLLSSGWEGHHFQNYYHCPVFVNLDYAAMPKYCKMLKLLAGANGIENQHEFLV